MSARKFRWTVEIVVDETWVADGFDIDDERAREMVGSQLRYAYGDEYSARVLKAPDAACIRKAQGYEVRA